MRGCGAAVPAVSVGAQGVCCSGSGWLVGCSGGVLLGEWLGGRGASRFGCRKGAEVRALACPEGCGASRFGGCSRVEATVPAVSGVVPAVSGVGKVRKKESKSAGRFVEPRDRGGASRKQQRPRRPESAFRDASRGFRSQFCKHIDCGVTSEADQDGPRNLLSIHLHKSCRDKSGMVGLFLQFRAGSIHPRIKPRAQRARLHLEGCHQPE